MTSSRRDEGAVLILVALSMTALLLVVALVVDLGATRSDRRGGQSAVDASVASATQDFAKNEDIVEACETAFDYLRVNLDTPNFVGDDCATALAGACNPASERSVRRTSGQFTATFTHPVIDGSSLMEPSTVGSVALPSAADEAGAPCERVGLRLTTSGEAFFGGVAGQDTRSSTVSAVGRADFGNTVLRALNLLVLERHDCDAMTVGGNNTRLVVASPEDDSTTPTVDESDFPGILAVDSDARDCTGSNDTLEVNGNGAQIIAEGPCADPAAPVDSCGQIDVFATLTDPSCSPTTDANQFACDEGQGSISPDAGQSIAIYGRAPADHRYNCKPSYGTDWQGNPEPWAAEQPIGPCAAANDPLTTDHVDQLRRFVANSAASTFTVIDDCNPSSQVIGAGNYYVDCPTYRVNSGSNVEFAGGNVVFAGRVEVQNSSSLTLHACAGTSPATCADDLTWSPGTAFDHTQSAPEAAWAFISGRLSVSGSGTLTMNNTALFIGPSGELSQSGTIRSTAPDDDGVAGAAGPFDDLGLWSESPATHSFRGGGANYFEGLYFGGRAHFAMSGGTNVELRAAQFVSNTMAFSGGVVFTMSPTGDRSLLFEVPASYSLIR